MRYAICDVCEWFILLFFFFLIFDYRLPTTTVLLNTDPSNQYVVLMFLNDRLLKSYKVLMMKINLKSFPIVPPLRSPLHIQTKAMAIVFTERSLHAVGIVNVYWHVPLPRGVAPPALAGSHRGTCSIAVVVQFWLRRNFSHRLRQPPRH